MKPLPYDKVKQLIPQAQAVQSIDLITEFHDYFHFHGIAIRGKRYEVDLGKNVEQLPSLSQIDWARRAQLSSQDHTFGAASLPVYHALFQALYQHKDTPAYKGVVKHARQYLREYLANNQCHTLTQIFYRQEELDTIIHDLNLSTEYGGEEYARGRDGTLLELRQHSSLLCTLFGVDSLDAVGPIYRWMFGKSLFIERLPSVPMYASVAEQSVSIDLQHKIPILYLYTHPERSLPTINIRYRELPSGGNP